MAPSVFLINLADPLILFFQKWMSQIQSLVILKQEKLKFSSACSPYEIVASLYYLSLLRRFCEFSYYLIKVWASWPKRQNQVGEFDF